MNIKPADAIRKSYNSISELCKSTGRPVYLTKNGEGDLVVMDIAAFTHREAMLKLRENLIASAEERLNCQLGFSIDEVTAKMNDAIREVVNG